MKWFSKSFKMSERLVGRMTPHLRRKSGLADEPFVNNYFDYQPYYSSLSDGSFLDLPLKLHTFLLRYQPKKTLNK